MLHISRRAILKGIANVPAYVAAAKMGSTFSSENLGLPDKKSFPFEGVFLDAAYTHPLSVQVRKACEDYLSIRMQTPSHRWPHTNDRDAAVALFAPLINAAPTDVAVVPSTLEGENLVGAAVGLGPNAGVVTDAYHYDASLARYGELAKRGVPVEVVSPKDGRIDLDDFEKKIEKNTRLVAISLVSSITGYQHDLKKLCEIAHAKGALVYADIVQAAGAVPIDVAGTGVDFTCCGTYKWLMGDFGVAFLYVRPDRLQNLQRTQFGWRQMKKSAHHVYPYDLPGSALGDWTLGTDTASLFEVSTPDWSALAMAVASLTYIRSLGVEAIMNHRKPMMEHLQAELPKLGFAALTPRASNGPIASFAYKGVSERLSAALNDAHIKVTLYQNMVRISPSIYNEMSDIERFIEVVGAKIKT